MTKRRDTKTSTTPRKITCMTKGRRGDNTSRKLDKCNHKEKDTTKKVIDDYSKSGSTNARSFPKARSVMKRTGATL